jgi:hypothetical protein
LGDKKTLAFSRPTAANPFVFMHHTDVMDEKKGLTLNLEQVF